MDEDLDRAAKSLLVGALGHNNAVYFVDADSGDHVNAGGYSYDDDSHQRILYLEALKQLVGAGLCEHKGGVLYELSYSGLKLAKQLVGSGFIQHKPNP